MHRVPNPPGSPGAGGEWPRPRSARPLRRYDDLPGRPLSVTQILSLTFPQPGLDEWKIREAVRLAREYPNEPAAGILDRHRGPGMARGTKVHKAIQAHILETDGPRLDPIGNEMFRHWRTWWEDAGLDPIGVEEVIVGPGYAGTLDCHATIGPGWAGTLDCHTDGVVIDWKTCRELPKEPFPDHCAQLAAYAAGEIYDGDYWLGPNTGMVVYIAADGVRAFEIMGDDWERASLSWSACLSLAASLWPEHFEMTENPERKP